MIGEVLTDSSLSNNALNFVTTVLFIYETVV